MTVSLCMIYLKQWIYIKVWFVAADLQKSLWCAVRVCRSRWRSGWEASVWRSVKKPSWASAVQSGSSVPSTTNWTPKFTSPACRIAPRASSNRSVLRKLTFPSLVFFSGFLAWIRGLHEARTRPVPEIVWPDPSRAAQLNSELEPGPYPRSSDPTRAERHS